MTLFRTMLAAVVLLLPGGMNAAARLKAATVPQCTGVTLSAAYLALVTPAEGPGFLLVITNNTNQPVKLVRPIPTSAHWYAQAGSGHWLWRASTGSGGALANALGSEHGPLLAYPPGLAVSTPEYVTVAAHQHLELAESMRSSPILRFRPGCQRCRNPEDRQYRAVLAYAYLPPSGVSEPQLLTCGLRSGPIVMPPLE